MENRGGQYQGVYSGQNYPQNPSQHEMGQQGHDMNQFRLTPQELQVMKQCNIESFYQRSLPAAAGFGMMTYSLIQAGYLKRSPKWGMYPKITVACFFGYFLGKLSYQKKCAEKLMALPNSRLGEMLRQRQRRGGGDSFSLDSGFTAPLGLDSFSDLKQPQASHLDLDSDRPFNEGLNDSGRPSVDDQTLDEETIPLPPGGVPTATTYEELRRRNRDEHEPQRARQYRSLSDNNPPQSMRSSAGSALDPSPPPSMRQPKNKYGDVWEQ